MAIEYEKYQPKSFDELYQSQKALFMPDMRRAQQQQYGWLQRQGQRMGRPHAQLFASQASEGFAPAIGKAGAAAATSAREMEQKDIQFGAGIDVKREQMAIQQQQWEQQLAEMVKSREQSGQLGLLPYTGFTPEMMELLGMDFSQRGLGDWRQFQRTLGQYNLPGQPLGQGGQPQSLTAQQQLQLSMFYPGASRAYKGQAASNWGWSPPGSTYY
ncbi:unnamed protein product [marine sediment metagenome]|uniref:Uncharacterized protein n=1 Tax=marine sediment metagenome TaxID=412755 RepID=X1VEF0_9ZZZZ